MAMFKNLESFTYSSIENFPKDVCTIPDKNENGIFVSNKKYLVLYIDIRFPVEKYITYATPYVWMDNGNQTFGWSGLDGGLLLGNVENSCISKTSCGQSIFNERKRNSCDGNTS